MHHKILNFRNIGGIKTEQGTIIDNYFYRGGPLHQLSLETIETLQKELRIKTVIDFRDNHEIERQANHKNGFEIHHLNIIGDQQIGQANPSQLMARQQEADPKDMMIELYRHIINSPHSQLEYTRFFEILLETDTPVYFHCSAGKDRTGLAAAFLLKALGASDEDIYEDYLLTNELSRPNIECRLNQLENPTPQQQAFVHAFFGVHKEYLDAAYEEILKQYDTVEDYLEEAFGLTDFKRQQLRAKFVR